MFCQRGYYGEEQYWLTSGTNNSTTYHSVCLVYPKKEQIGIDQSLRETGLAAVPRRITNTSYQCTEYGFHRSMAIADSRRMPCREISTQDSLQRVINHLSQQRVDAYSYVSSYEHVHFPIRKNEPLGILCQSMTIIGGNLLSISRCTITDSRLYHEFHGTLRYGVTDVRAMIISPNGHPRRSPPLPTSRPPGPSLVGPNR